MLQKKLLVCGGLGKGLLLPEPFPTTSIPPLPVEIELSKVPFPLFESHSFSHSRNEDSSRLFTEGERWKGVSVASGDRSRCESPLHEMAERAITG